jgi:hypothetical protein
MRIIDMKKYPVIVVHKKISDTVSSSQLIFHFVFL